MILPYFFIDQLTNIDERLMLDEEQSKHIVQVLRKQKDEEILLTDGKGAKAHAVIVDDHRKRCEVKIISIEQEKEQLPKISIAISLIKNAARFEWFLEKAVEIGVTEIIPLICERTEKEKFRFDRMQNILISAMLQSQQCWLPNLHQPIAFEKIVEQNIEADKFIAHCLPHQKLQLASFIQNSKLADSSIHHSPLPTTNSQLSTSHSLILIGPEGDFTEKEIQNALSKNFRPVALGNTRLRTETAGIFASIVLKLNALNG